MAANSTSSRDSSRVSKIGRRVGGYRILERIGEGGMGVVFRARDVKLGRDVALKMLAEEFALDADRLARFEREARVLAALDHPNIGGIHGVEEEGSTRFLVLELVTGETLAECLARGRPPFDEALEICRQIALALEAAHDRGIVHRDLKPANIKLTPKGLVKLLDFGLAKPVRFDRSPGAADSPTLGFDTTRAGQMLGTTAYMSPEQLRGQEVDRRTDIWAFGCLLYECLAGRRAFAGESLSDVVAAILEREPDWSALPPDLPAKLRDLLRRCLQKDPDRRERDVADARLEIEELTRAPDEAAEVADLAPSRQRRKIWPWLFGAFAFLMLGVVLAWPWIESRRPGRFGPAGPAARFQIAAPVPVVGPGDLALPALALSTDGTRLVWISDDGGTPHLYQRALDELPVTPVEGSHGALGVFLSPDGESAGFFAAGRLHRVPLGGGPARTLADAPVPRGGAWGPDGRIVYAPYPEGGLWSVQAQGGEPEPLTAPDPTRNERSHRWPCLLPDGDTVLFTVGTSTMVSFDEARIEALSFESGERRPLISGGSYPVFLPPDRLLYARGDAILAVAFDPERLEVTGEETTVVHDVVTAPTSGFAHFAASAVGSIAYVAGPRLMSSRRLAWVAEDGSEEPLPTAPSAFMSLRLSPDGRHLALVEDAANLTLSKYDLTRDALTRLAFEWSNNTPVWHPSGEQIAFSSARGKLRDVYRLPAAGGRPELVIGGPNRQWPTSWSPDGALLAYTEENPETGLDLWLLPAEAGAEPRPFLRTSFDETSASFSPDGRWLAYVSSESGREEVYVRRVAGGEERWQVSTGGGSEPAWSPESATIYFRAGRQILVARFTAGPPVTIGRPRPLFEGDLPAQINPDVGPVFDVAPDGRRIVVVLEQSREAEPRSITVLLNWSM